jgi:hypothetical protein
MQASLSQCSTRANMLAPMLLEKRNNNEAASLEIKAYSFVHSFHMPHAWTRELVSIVHHDKCA